MSVNLVGDRSVELAGVMGDILGKYRAGQITLEHLINFSKMESTPFALTVQNARLEIEKFAAKTARKLSKVFKKRIFIDPLPPAFKDEQQLAFWATFNMRPVFFPGEDIGASRVIKGWTKLQDWFYNNVANGNIEPMYSDLPPTQLRRGWYLADFTVSADYIDGSQVFVNDPLAPIITSLREKKLVGKYDNTPAGSRFAITWDEWNDCVLAHVASKLGVTRAQTCLERAIEFNAIGNLYDPNRGKFNSWEWFQDYFGGSGRLCGGFRVCGGLAHVDPGWRVDRSNGIAGRPLVSFVQ